MRACYLFIPVLFLFLAGCGKEDDDPVPQYDYRREVTGFYIGIKHVYDTNTSTNVAAHYYIQDTLEIEASAGYPERILINSSEHTLATDYTFARSGSPLSTSSSGSFSNVQTDSVRIRHSTSANFNPQYRYTSFSALRQ